MSVSEIRSYRGSTAACGWRENRLPARLDGGVLVIGILVIVICLVLGIYYLEFPNRVSELEQHLSPIGRAIFLDLVSYHVRIKICGVTTVADAKLAARLGADALGLNFAQESPRRITPIDAESILRELPPFIEPVGVFVNQPLRDLFTQAEQLGRVRTVQWHGKQRELSDGYPFRLIQAFQIRDKQSILEMERYLDLCRNTGQLPAAVLVDGFHPTQLGGTGATAPWKLIAKHAPKDVPLILAGGLTPDNVGEAIRIVKPYAVDVASGVEMTLGKKDPAKIAQFTYNARLAASQAS